MNSKKGKTILAISMLIGFGTASSQYVMKKSSINSVGNHAEAGRYVLKATAGQAVSSSTLTGGNYRVEAGLWQQNNDLIFKNNFK